ncbi:MAG: hypothetical protein Q7R93_01105 [bacterium]|nr:hypothetical protein [bacterium]
MNQKQNHTQTVLICVGLLLTGFVLSNMIPSNKNNPKPQQKTEDSPRVALQRTLQQYLSPLSDTKDWWIVSTPPPGLEAANALAAALLNVSNVLQSARSASPVTEEIAQNFGMLFASVFENGISRVTSAGEIDMESLRKSTEVCFFSRNDYEKKALPALLYYREDWRALMIGGVKWSGPIFGGVVYHELYHALQHRKGESAPIGSEKDMREEIEAHELEMVVLNYLTKGKYLKEVESILHGHVPIHDERILLGVVTTNAFLRLDTVIGLENAGSRIRGTSTAQHILSLGFQSINKRGGTKEDKVALYQWIRKN